MTANEIIDALGLEPHPEGGYFRETYRHQGKPGERGACTAIFFLLLAHQPSRWHRVTDADEIWHYYAGAPVRLHLGADMEHPEARLLGPSISEGMRPQEVVPAGIWQMAESMGPWSLVGCTVAPAFSFDAFEIAPAD